MKKNLIKLFAILSALLCLTGCVRKTTEDKSEQNIDYDAVVKIGGQYKIFDEGYITDNFAWRKFHSNDLTFSSNWGDVAIYTKSKEIEAVINQINLMSRGEGDQFQIRLIYFGENGMEDYQITSAIPYDSIDTVVYDVSDGTGKETTNVMVPMFQYIVYTCPVGSESALDLAREQLGLDLK